MGYAPSRSEGQAEGLSIMNVTWPGNVHTMTKNYKYIYVAEHGCAQERKLVDVIGQ